MQSISPIYSFSFVSCTDIVKVLRLENENVEVLDESLDIPVMFESLLSNSVKHELLNVSLSVVEFTRYDPTTKDRERRRLPDKKYNPKCIHSSNNNAWSKCFRDRRTIKNKCRCHTDS